MTARLTAALRGRGVTVSRFAGEAARAPRGGSALIIALWTIALLSMLIMSFALDALLEGKINVYVKQRRHVDYLTQSGIAIAEMLLLDYPSATASSSVSTTGTTAAEDDDKWLQVKLDLQRGSCKVDHYAIDPDVPENGLLTVEITSADANHWPVNLLTKSDVADQIWESVLNVIGLPMEFQEEVVDSWYDWVDADSTVTGRSGAEDEYYDGLENKALNGKRLKMPRNGPIISIAELEMIRGIREHPAIFRGGVLEPDKKSRFKKDEVVIQYGLKAFFDIYGEAVKINVNSAAMEVLMTVPGIDGDVDLAGAIVEERRTGANRVVSSAASADSLLFKDWSDLNTRIPGGVPLEAEAYLAYAPQKFFEIKATGESGGISHQIKAVAVVENSKVRYLRWREDP
jgi:type II secretory pathway component PulK